MYFSTHAAERAAERYGIVVSQAEWSRAILDIIDTVAGDAKAAVLVAHLPAGKEKWAVRLGSTPVLAVYAPDQATIVTVTPVASQFNQKRTGFVRGRNQWSTGRKRRERVVEEDWGE